MCVCVCVCVCPHTVAKDPDITQTIEADSAATRRVCVNLGAAEEEDSDDVMEDSDNGQYTFHQYVYIYAAVCCIELHMYIALYT